MNYYTGLIVLSFFVAVQPLDVPENKSSTEIPIEVEVYAAHLPALFNASHLELLKQENDSINTTENQDVSSLQQKEVILNICCEEHQKWNSSSNKCVDSNQTSSNKVEFLIHNFVVNTNMEHALINSVQFKHGYNLQNKCSHGDVLSKASIYFMKVASLCEIC